MGFLLLLGLAALLVATSKKPAVANALSPLMQMFSATVGWPKQPQAAMQTGRHYFFTLPIAGDLKAGGKLAQLNIALSLMGWQGVKLFPQGADMATADSPHPDDWASDPGLRVSGTWNGSAGQTFNLQAMQPFGANTVTMWIPTESFVAMHASKP